MRKLIVDTNVFIDWKRSGRGCLIELLELKKNKKVKLFVPTVVILEFWSGEELNRKIEKKRAVKMFGGFQKTKLTEKIAKKAGELLRKKQVSQAMDAIVGATAIVIEAELVTNNKKHFEKIKELKLF